MVPPSGFTSPGCGYAGAGLAGGGAAGGIPAGGMPAPGGCMTGGPAGVPIAPGGCGVPNDGGATPSIVPLSFEGTGAAAPGFGAPGAPGAAAPGAPLGRGTPPCCGEFIISMVPLNLGAAAPFRLKPHFLQVFELSSFSVPQFGQNTISPPVLPHVRDKKVAGYTACRRVHKFSNGSCPKCRYDFWGASDLAACATGEAGEGRVDARALGGRGGSQADVGSGPAPHPADVLVGSRAANRIASDRRGHPRFRVGKPDVVRSLQGALDTALSRSLRFARPGLRVCSFRLSTCV